LASAWTVLDVYKDEPCARMDCHRAIVPALHFSSFKQSARQLRSLGLELASNYRIASKYLSGDLRV
jgi:hypothetical protein